MKIIMILWDNQKKSLEAGRSMVEMLGVLAIIGVLSIGSVSGYSKAMFKYKLNKQTEQLETLIYNGLMLKDNFNFTTFTYLSPYLIKLNLIPKEMLTTNENILIDSFHNNVVIYYHDNGFYAVSIYLKEDSTRYAICQNMFMIAKKNSSDLMRTEILINKNDGSSTLQKGVFWGDAYCTSGANCIKDLNLVQAEEACRSCETYATCNPGIMWK